MEINKFNYFANQQVGDSKKTADVDAQDFDLDLQTVNQGGGDPIVQGSGHIWCHITQKSCQNITGCYCTLTLVHCN